jgi:hypothetical protein
VTLHVTNGDCTVPGLRGAGVPEPILVWADVLHEGPVPDVPDDDLRRVRAAFLGAGKDVFEERDRTLAAHDELVLWFEADLYDQLQLVQILRAARAAPDAITLVCIGEHVGIARFGGLGELSSEQLSRLRGAPLTAAAVEYARRAWAALRAPDPAGVNEIATSRSTELRFVAEAYDRLAREYPSTRDGLSLTERRLLAAVAAGAGTAGAAFVRAAARELRPVLGDTWAFDRIARLAQTEVPRLAAEPPVGRATSVALTDAGREVLSGRADHVALNGVDRWIGGVHLSGRDVPWRFDEGTETVSAR